VFRAVTLALRPRWLNIFVLFSFGLGIAQRRISSPFESGNLQWNFYGRAKIIIVGVGFMLNYCMSYSELASS